MGTYKYVIVLFISVLFIKTISAQDHFIKIWSGSPYQAMNIFLESATLDGNQLSAGDEIGIFDGSICVGAIKLNGPVPSYAEIKTSADNPITTEADGFTSGHSIVYKLWDSDTQQEIDNVIVNYDQTSPDSSFTPLGTAFVKLSFQTNQNSESHFTCAWSGSPYQAMNIFLESATFNEGQLSSGDEIGVFDGSICVGIIKLSGPVAGYPEIKTSTDDPLTTEIDGFTSGHNIVYKLWKHDLNTEIVNVTITYNPESPIPSFTSLGTAFVNLNFIAKPYAITELADNITSNSSRINGSINPNGTDLSYLFQFGTTTNYEYSTTAKSAGNGNTLIPFYETITGLSYKTKYYYRIIAFNNIDTVYGMDSTFTTKDTSFNLQISSEGNGNSHIKINEVKYQLPYTNNHNSGVEMAIYVVPDSNCKFIHWKGDTSCISNPIYIKMYKDRNLIIVDSIVTDIANGNFLPSNFVLSQNYPNPFNPTTTINYSVPSLSFVTMKVYNILGNEVAVLVNEEKHAGNYSIQFSVSNSQMTSGIYFYRMQAGSFIKTKKLILLK